MRLSGRAFAWSMLHPRVKPQCYIFREREALEEKGEKHLVSTKCQPIPADFMNSFCKASVSHSMSSYLVAL